MSGRGGRAVAWWPDFLLVVVAAGIPVVGPFLFRGKEAESFESLDPTEPEVAVSALPMCTESSASKVSDLSDAALGAVSVNEALTSELPSLLFDLSLPPTRPRGLPVRSGDESICSGDSRKKNRDWWLNAGPPIVGNSGTVTCFDVAVAVSRVELTVPGGCWTDLDVGGRGAYCGGIANCGGKTCNRWGTAKPVTAFGTTLGTMYSEVALTRPGVRLGDADRRAGAKCEGG